MRQQLFSHPRIQHDQARRSAHAQTRTERHRAWLKQISQRKEAQDSIYRSKKEKERAFVRKQWDEFENAADPDSQSTAFIAAGAEACVTAWESEHGPKQPVNGSTAPQQGQDSGAAVSLELPENEGVISGNKDRHASLTVKASQMGDEGIDNLRDIESKESNLTDDAILRKVARQSRRGSIMTSVPQRFAEEEEQ
jgi:hypothetical protein